METGAGAGREGGFVALDPNNGAILALGGGFDLSQPVQPRGAGAASARLLRRSSIGGWKGFTPASLISGADCGRRCSPEDEWRPEDYRAVLRPDTPAQGAQPSLNLGSTPVARHYAGTQSAWDARVQPEKLPKNLLTLGTADNTAANGRGSAVFANGRYRIRITYPAH
jgi:penicillin-binding protein 1A